MLLLGTKGMSIKGTRAHREMNKKMPIIAPGHRITNLATQDVTESEQRLPGILKLLATQVVANRVWF